VLRLNWAGQSTDSVPEGKLFRNLPRCLVVVDACPPGAWTRGESVAESAVGRLRDCGYTDYHRRHSAGVELVGCLGNSVRVLIRWSDEKVPWSIGRFVDCLKPFAKQDQISGLMEGCGRITSSSSPLQRAQFAKCLMDNFERQFPEDVRAKALENCGRACIGASTIAKARGVKRNARSLAELVVGLNKQHIGGGRLRLENNRIHVEYGRCYCGMVSKTKERFSSTYCNCSRGYLLELFEQVLEKPVTVDLVESVIQGAKSCKFTIHL